MRITTNEKLIKQRSTIARYATFGGLGLLMASLVTSFTREDYIGLAYAALLAGFVCAIIGSTLANRWLKLPRAEQVLERSLKGIDNKHHLFNYLLPAQHVLITPTGLVVFKARIIDGAITYKNGKWGRPFKFTRIFGGMGQEPLSDPIAELKVDIARIKQFLADKLDGAGMIPVDGYVVFTDPRAKVSVDDPELPVVAPADLKETLRKTKRGPILAQSVLDNLERVFNEHANAKTAK